MINKLWILNSINLKLKPETGMGYQLIKAIPAGSNIFKKFVVYNTELIVEIDSNFQKFKNQIISEGYNIMLSKSPELTLKTESIEVLNKNILGESIKLSATESLLFKRNYGGKGATDNIVQYANGNEIFVRVSAYEDDKRIDFVKKRLIDGTFTTTKNDYDDCVSKNDNPVDRYALPNDETIKWAFYIKPNRNDTLQKGVVQPAFGHKGGGIEAYFKNGTSNETYLEKKTYGK